MTNPFDFDEDELKMWGVFQKYNPYVMKAISAKNYERLKNENLIPHNSICLIVETEEEAEKSPLTLIIRKNTNIIHEEIIEEYTEEDLFPELPKRIRCFLFSKIINILSPNKEFVLIWDKDYRILFESNIEKHPQIEKLNKI
jgi:hypothetical protein